jgi:hypothetical protein
MKNDDMTGRPLVGGPVERAEKQRIHKLTVQSAGL